VRDSRQTFLFESTLREIHPDDLKSLVLCTRL
jgi:hypothetical protein